MNAPMRLVRNRPPGAISSSAEMLDIIIEARREKKAIRLYSVNQGGHLMEHFVCSRTRYVRNKKGGLCSGPGFDEFNTWNKSMRTEPRSTSERYYRGRILAGSYGIAGTIDTVHRLFQNRRLAEQYAELLRNDAEYMKSVRDWHAYCREAFRFF